jgi:large subunit ribosomal protein L15
MPLIRKMPKRGFNNAAFKTVYAVVNVSDLDAQFENGASVDEQALRNAGLVRGTIDGVKILGNGDLSKKLSIVAAKVSASAREKIEKAGGSVSVK